MDKKFAVSAYIEHGADILLVQHIKQRSLVPVGGKLLENETPQEAVIREVYEETGLEYDIDYSFFDFTSFEMGLNQSQGLLAYEEHEVLPTGMHMCFSFMLAARHKDIKPCYEYTDTTWFSLEEWKHNTREVPPNVRKLMNRCFHFLHRQ